MRYRAEIDGLRALAVSAVVVYHASSHWAPGGFAGVDIFFAISGYLITGIIVRALDRDEFSIVDFYSRRVRRIFPALAVVLAATFVLGWNLLPALDLAEIGKHIAAGSFFVSNFALWKEVGYFDISGRLKPLVHLWSLGVEEQFYLFWPVLLVGIRKLRLRTAVVLGCLFVASAATSICLNRFDPDAAFYLPVSRLWEIMAGGLLAIAEIRNKHWLRIARAPVLRELLPALGAFMMLAAIRYRTPPVSVPGWNTLIPVLGAIFVISAGSASWINRSFFSNPGAVFIGKVSYPLYLWHWVLISFLTITVEPSRKVMAGVILLSLALAILTYFLIEMPIRSKILPRPVSILVCSIAAIGCLGAATFAAGGFPSRFPPELNGLSVSRKMQGENGLGPCFLDSKHQREPSYPKECVSEGPGSELIMLWGDSHAGHLYPGLLKTIGSRQIRIARFTASACPPFVADTLPPDSLCQRVSREVMRRVAELQPSTVILGDVWEREKDRLAGNLSQTVRYLRANGAHRIIVFGPLPRWEPALAVILLRQYHAGAALSHRMRPPMPKYGKTRMLDVKLRKIAESLGVEYIASVDVFCNEEGCLTIVGDLPGGLVIRDSNHLSRAGSTFLFDRLEDQGKLLLGRKTR